MKQVRAFSDTEIVTIAAVAASALGGIVIGLGRGQENGSGRTADNSALQSALERVRESGNSIKPSITAPEISIDHRPLREAVRSAAPEALSFAKSAMPNIDAEAALSAARKRVPHSGAEPRASVTDQLKSLAQSALDSSLQDAANAGLKNLRNQSNTLLGNLLQSESSKATTESAQDDSIIAKVSAGIESVEDEIATAPDVVKSAKETSQRVAREHVGRPVARAVSSTTDATKESMAALAWLGLGTAVVYFGLLSADRREQVKDALCGVIEQTRLLILDLQGYESEM